MKKMTNGEKFKTAEEQLDAFKVFCARKKCCSECEIGDTHRKVLDGYVCPFAWLKLEAKAEKPMPCPFCGQECRIVKNKSNAFVVGCDYCNYSSKDYDREQDAIAAHNHVFKLVSSCRKES